MDSKTQWTFLSAATLLLALSITGCATAPAEFTYNSPHPYLLITKGMAPTETKTTKEVKEPAKADQKDGKEKDEDKDKAKKDAGRTTTTTTKETRQQKNDLKNTYSARIIYLPGKEQTLKIKRGTGEFDWNLQFEEGWKLTAFNGKSDGKTAETVEAVGGVLTSLTDVLGFKPGEVEDMDEEEVSKLVQGLHGAGIEPSSMEEIRAGVWLVNLRPDGESNLLKSLEWSSTNDIFGKIETQ